MKIRVIDRIVLFLLALAGLAAGVMAALKEFGISVLALIPKDMLPVIPEGMLLYVRIAVIAVVILLSCYLFGISFRRKKKPEPFINMESGNKGSIRMSMESISGLVLRTCGNIPGITGLKVSTINHEDSVSVDMTFQVEVDRNIPELSGQIQQLVGEVVEKNCGVAVRKVCVTVSGFIAPKAPALPEAEKPEKRSLFGREKKQTIETKASEPVVEAEPEAVVIPVPAAVVEEIVPEEEIENAAPAEETAEIEAVEMVEAEEAAVEPVIIAEEPVEEEEQIDENDEYAFLDNE